LTALVTFVGVTHPWMCDAMGHVNVRHYAAMFDDAGFHLLGAVAGAEEAGAPRRGWADVRSEIDFQHETPPGALLTIRSHVEKVGRTSITYVHRMEASVGSVLHATARLVTVRFDLEARVATMLTEAERARAEALTL
jgi:acyl-CoA thioester hydrolase